MTYSHLAIIYRIEMLKRIDSSRLDHIIRSMSPAATQQGAHEDGWLMIRADAPHELMERITRGKLSQSKSI
jgi:hypothetical protein